MAKKKQSRKKATPGGWDFYPIDAKAMDADLNTNAFQQVGNAVLEREIKRGKKRKGPDGY